MSEISSDILKLIDKKVIDIIDNEALGTHFRILFEDGYILRIPKVLGVELLKKNE
ncbi:hypothetical protein [Clostridium magnum]|uniref:Uncharacterized protein n=1 Tax=Clostridium magnum DSM 2767 TaxID=1121326 RepID=A0A162QPE0_9CLOT|nr:hypothetical protein [Clostridium magnum]KZL88784.1 hypothetical protein CLMAG_58770 [Clostridium magnum DSM 2767]SHJ57380.1 hypothetical protein SAMN02745944_06175 [Clostridium magnum DSM 2767]